MKLSTLKPTQKINGKRIFLRVDWNVPLHGGLGGEDSLKINRTIETIKNLSERGAIVLIATHLGRPKKSDPAYSTKKILSMVASYTLGIHFLQYRLDTKEGLKSVQEEIQNAKEGALFLLENVRYYAGEEKNSPILAKAFASLADMFINDAFASCHRTHASVVGITKYLPAYAGPSLMQEVHALDALVHAPKKPFVAVIGGAKLSTKVPVLHALLNRADTVLVGGAMANIFFAAQKKEIGKSFVEKESIMMAKKLLKNKNLILPSDVAVAKKLEAGYQARVCSVDDVEPDDMIGDIGVATMKEWSVILKKAKTICWNGPVGVCEVKTFSHGSLFIARVIGSISKGKCFGVAGGGDTLPVVLGSGVSKWFDHISTGGGAMLEYIAHKGSLPGLKAILKK